jgi:hypothetical protein
MFSLTALRPAWARTKSNAVSTFSGWIATSGSRKFDLERLVFGQPSQLLNISTRMRVLTGDQVLIGGFIITGTELKRVIIRGIGPSLNGVGVTLSDPTLELHQPDGTVITNDNWKINAQTGQSQEADIRAATVPPTDDLESAIVATLPPDNYTAIVRGKNNTTGVGLVGSLQLAIAAWFVSVLLVRRVPTYGDSVHHRRYGFLGSVRMIARIDGAM